MSLNTCKKCGGTNCTCKKSIHELAKANPNKTYSELEQLKAEQDTYENNSKHIFDWHTYCCFI